LLATMPYWFFLARQSMTDMPYAAPLAASLGLCLIGFGAEPEARARLYPIRLGTRVITPSAYHLFAGALLMVVLPQLVYLASRNLTWLFATEPRLFFRLHPDAFLVGSGGHNCGLPGNQACALLWPRSEGILAQPAVTALGFAALTGLRWPPPGTSGAASGSPSSARGWWCPEHARQGRPGLVIPLFTIACFLLASGRPPRPDRLELAPLVLILAVVVLPWFVQSYLRHGWPFLDRLLFHDMYKRAFVHVHDTNAGADTSLRYYVAQLGYGPSPGRPGRAGARLRAPRAAGGRRVAAPGRGPPAALVRHRVLALHPLAHQVPPLRAPGDSAARGAGGPGGRSVRSATDGRGPGGAASRTAPRPWSGDGAPRRHPLRPRLPPGRLVVEGAPAPPAGPGDRRVRARPRPRVRPTSTLAASRRRAGPRRGRGSRRHRAPRLPPPGPVGRDLVATIGSLPGPRG
jgi:hypothetical protein